MLSLELKTIRSQPNLGTSLSMQSERKPIDSTLWDFDLPLRAEYYPIGFPVEITTNSSAVLEAAYESWGKFRKIFSTPPVRIRLCVLPGSSTVCPPTPVCRGQENLITTIADAENYTVLDTREGFAFGWLTEAAVRNRAYLRYHFLEGASWFLLECLYLTSIHAACVSLNGRGVLLCGDSGAGKSSLSYACARNGWSFLSDDSTMLVRKSAGRAVTGNPYQMRFRDSAVQLFPELSKQNVTQRLSGEFSIELATPTVPDILTISKCFVDHLVFLNRHTPEPEGLFCFPKESALRWLEKVICYGEKHVREEHKAALRNLIAADVFEMRYTRFDTALSLLEELVSEGPAVARPCLAAAGDR